MNYQYRFGAGFRESISILYEDGGLRRYYQGIGAALIQGMCAISRHLHEGVMTTQHHITHNSIGPVSRFGDTAANAGILALLESNAFLNQLPTLIKTIFASLWYVSPHPLPHAV